MPEYEFIRANGDVVQKFFSMADAPEIGATVEIDGEPARRLPPRLAGASVKNYEHVSYSIPRNCVHAPRLDDKGRAVFQSKRELKETIAKMNADPSWGGRQYHWDD